VNNLLPNTRELQGLIRATHTENPRVQAPAEPYEPGGRRFESCRARQPSLVYSGHMVTVYSGDIGNTFGVKGLSIGSSRMLSSSKYPRS
jgi:hypothetical protein